MKLKQYLPWLVLACLLPQLAWAFEPFTVQHIQVRGLKRVSEGAVLKELPIRRGELLTEAESREAIQALYRTGLFKEVRLNRDRNTLVVDLVERSTITEVKLVGVKSSDPIKKILKEAHIAEGYVLNPSQLSEVQQNLEQYYLSQGRYGVKIEYKTEEVEPGLVRVTFDIYEGDVAKIKEIRFLGVNAFPEKELVKQMHHATTNWLSFFSGDDKYSKEKWNADLEILRSYYMDRGYMDMRIESSQVSVTPDKKHIYMTIQIDEGPLYRVGDVRMGGRLPISEEKFADALKPLKTGDVFSRQTVMDVKTEVEDVLGSEGYSFAEVQPIPEVDEAQHVMSVVFHVEANRRVYVRRIHIKGNATTQDEVLRRELLQMEGAPLSTRLIKAGKERIVRRGYGNKVDVETSKVFGSSDLVDVDYQIEEAKMGQIGVGLEYSQAQRLGWNFSISQENFLGTGKTIDFNFDKNQSVTNYAFGYYDPYFTIDGVGMGYRLYYNRSHLSRTTSLSNYATDTRGMELYWLFPMAKYESITVSAGYDETHLKADTTFNAQEIKDFLNKNGNRFKEFTLGAGWNYDSLDRRRFPRKGFSQTLAVRSSTPGSRLQYYRVTHDSSWYYPISSNERWIVNVATTLGYANGYGKTDRLPFYKNFTAGGSRWVRGFEENSLGPKDSIGNSFGGNALAAATLNFIFPNPIKPEAESLRTALFLDVGQVYDTRYKTRTLPNGTVIKRNSPLRYTMGVSLSWDSPMGPIMLSLAKPLNMKPGDERRTFGIGAATNF